MADDEAEIYEGIRAQFPQTFGKQSKSQTPLEIIHNTTRRVDSSTSSNNDFPSLSSSSKSWLNSLRKDVKPKPNSVVAGSELTRSDGGVDSINGCLDGGDAVIGPSRLFSEGRLHDNDGGDVMIGPPRPNPRLDSIDEDEMIGPPRPPPSKDSPDDDDDDDDDDNVGMIGPPRPPPGLRRAVDTNSEDDDDDDDDYEVEEEPYRIPLSNEIMLKGHTKIVTALAIDHSGSRVLSGGYDNMVRMYDFQGMNSRLQSFRQIEPAEGHPVRSLSWSPSADRFLCVTGTATAKICDRDGLTLGEFMKGDMYIRDLKNTKGHITGLTCGEWHPKTKETILTSSEDGSLRIWDVNDFKSQKQVIKPKLANPGRTPVTTCAWDRDGTRIAGALGFRDYSIQIWNLKPGWGSRPDLHIVKAHTDDITGVKFSSDGRMLLSRSMDDSLKVWDLRQTKEPLKVLEELPNRYAQTNIAFSPDEKLFFTGTSVEKESTTGGMLCFYDKEKLELVSKVGISPTGSVVQCAWHPKLNQIFATSGEKNLGATHVLYDPSLSERGALVCVARAPRKKSVDDFEAKPAIHNPHALPLFRDEPSRKRQREKVLKDPLKAHKPDLPMTGPGFGGRVGTTKGSLLTQYLLKQGGLMKETWMDEDPREAILKYADVAEKEPKYIAPAYAQTQPETFFAKSDSEDEDK